MSTSGRSLVESARGLGALSRGGRRCGAVHYQFDVWRYPTEAPGEAEPMLRADGTLNWLDSRVRIEPDEPYVLDLDDGRRLGLVPRAATFMGRQAKFTGAHWIEDPPGN